MNFEQDLGGLVYESDSQIIQSIRVLEEYNLTSALSIGMLKPPAYWSWYVKRHSPEGKFKFASMADYYAAFKALENQFYGNGPQAEDIIRISSGLVDHLKSRICTSTNIGLANPEKQIKCIRHNYDFELDKAPTNTLRYASIPKGKILLEEALDNADYARYLRAIFNTNDQVNEIIRTLSFFSRIPSNKITHAAHAISEEKTLAAHMSIVGNELQVSLLSPCEEGRAMGVKAK